MTSARFEYKDFKSAPLSQGVAAGEKPAAAPSQKLPKSFGHFSRLCYFCTV
jgi:hypothetical protein